MTSLWSDFPWLTRLRETSWPPLVVIRALVCAGLVLVALKNTSCGSASECSALKAPGSPKTTELTSSSTRTELTYPGRTCKTTTCSGSMFKFTIRACGNSVCAEAMWKGTKQIVIRCTKLKHLFISHLFSQWCSYVLVQSPLREGKLF